MKSEREQGSAFLSRCGLAVLVFCVAEAGCRSGEEAPAPAAPDSAAHVDAAPPPIVPAPAVTQASWAPEALEELLAPIALYPDVLLTQILAASVNAQEVLDGGNWLLQNQNLQGAELDAAAEQAGFGPAMRALVQFPSVLDMMCQEIDWTRQLGSAFTSDQKGVLDTVQRLRSQAVGVGNLKSTPEQTVAMKPEGDKVIVEVKPAEPTVVYVPQYDPQVVYTAPPATVKEEDTVSTETAVAAGLLAFGAGVLVANIFEDDDYCYPHWGSGAVYYGTRPFYPPAYVYRPAYGPAFRPAYGYAPPAGYRHSYNDVDIDRNVNIDADNRNNYFNRFDGNQNLRAGAAQSPSRRAQQPAVQDRAARSSPAPRADSWKGQSEYAGTRPDGADRAHDAPGVRQDVARARAGDASVSNSMRARPEAAAGLAGQAPDFQGDRSRVDRGYDAAPRTQAPDMEPSGRGFDATERASAPAPRDSAFAGARDADSGSFERAASARGRASTGQQRASRGGQRR